MTTADHARDWRHKPVDHHASRAVTGDVAGYYYPPDEDVDDFCVLCVPELHEGGTWVHSRSCPARH
jgi:hypothetical protein